MTPKVRTCQNKTKLFAYVTVVCLLPGNEQTKDMFITIYILFAFVSPIASSREEAGITFGVFAQVHETNTNHERLHFFSRREVCSDTREDVKGKMLVFASGDSLIDEDRPLQEQLNENEVTYVAQPVSAKKAVKALAESLEHNHLRLSDKAALNAIASLAFPDDFSDDLEGVLLPNALQTLTFGKYYDARLDCVTLPDSLQSLTFGFDFDQSLESVTLPKNLKSLTFGFKFNQSLAGISLPDSLQELTFGCTFNQSMEGVNLPLALHTLTFGTHFNEGLGRSLDSGVVSLAFGFAFNQNLADVALPSSLQSLAFGYSYNQSLAGVALPSGLKTLAFERSFNQSLAGVTLPKGLQSLSFGAEFNQSLLGVTLPSSLETLIFGAQFSYSLSEVALPSLKTLSLGDSFAHNLVPWLILFVCGWHASRVQDEDVQGIGDIGRFCSFEGSFGGMLGAISRCFQASWRL